MAKTKTESKPVAEAKIPTLPRISVLDRRRQNPFGEGSPQVELKDPGWVVHVINTKLYPGRYHDVHRNKGWEPVLESDLVGTAEEYGFDVQDGRVVRGERGSEVLMKMPARDYQEIQMFKDAANKRLTNPTRMKRDVIEQAAGQYSDQAADFLDRNVSIKSERAPMPLEDVEN